MANVTVILPTYNRAGFLPEAFASIAHQSYKEWDLVVVDDGSADDTAAVVDEWTNRLDRPIKYFKQANRGAYGARNTGLDMAAGKYVAFFDSDDLWLPHHLEDCVAALERHPDVDWVFAACRCVDLAGRVIDTTTFEIDGRPRPFRALQTQTHGPLRIITDATVVECQLLHGLYAGLQNSVIRKRVFESHRFWEDYRVVEDSLFLVRALARGIRIAYLDDVHVVYRVHSDNSSGSATSASRDSLSRIQEERVRGLERIGAEVVLNQTQRRAWRRALARYLLWYFGYACYWEAGKVRQALDAMRNGLRLKPSDLYMWKTYLACATKSFLHLSPNHDI